MRSLFTQPHSQWRKGEAPLTHLHKTACGTVSSVVTRGHYYAIAVMGNSGLPLICSLLLCAETPWTWGSRGTLNMALSVDGQHQTWDLQYWLLVLQIVLEGAGGCCKVGESLKVSDIYHLFHMGKEIVVNKLSLFAYSCLVTGSSGIKQNQGLQKAPGFRRQLGNSH